MPFRRPRAALLLAILTFSISMSDALPPKQPTKKTPLTSVEAVTDIDAPKDPDDPGTGGGMDASNYFSRKLAAKLSDCTSQIRTVSERWVHDQKLHVISVANKPGDLTIDASQPDLQGFFEVVYRVKLPDERARVTVFFYTADGTPQDPAMIDKLLKTYKIDGFQDNLTHALFCGGS